MSNGFRRAEASPWLFIAAALLMIASGLIHLRLWVIGYRHVATLDVLFIVQVVASLLLAVVVATVRRLPVAVAGILLMGGTVVGFILSRTVGIFGFTLTFTSGLAVWSLIVECTAVVLLAIAVLQLVSESVRA